MAIRSNGGTPMLVGGHVALDLVNTVSWRLDPGRTVDRIPDYAALLDWAARTGLAEGPVPPGDAATPAGGAAPATAETASGSAATTPAKARPEQILTTFRGSNPGNSSRSTSRRRQKRAGSR